jgi:multidrug efflux system membrane fusion protein
MNVRLPHAFDAAPAGADGRPPRWRRDAPLLPVVLGIAALALAVILAWHFLAPAAAPQAPPPPPVTVARAQVKNVTVQQHSIGTVVAMATVSITAQVSGQLMSAGFREGQTVHEGDLLFQIDPRPFAAALEQAQAALARDEANAANAERDKTRYIALFAQRAASAQLRDQAVATAAADEAIVKSDKAAVTVAQLNLGYATIRSPINGKTGPILVQPGNLITANTSANPLVTITQIQPIKVSVSLPQSDVPRLVAQMRAGKLNALISLDGGAPITAPIDFIGNQVDARTGTIELRATFPNSDGRLVPGQLVDVGVSMQQYPDAIVVPREAVNLGPANDYVYVVSKDDIAQLRNVTELYDDGTNAAITGDVKAGDTVIVQGQLRVQSGRAVTIADGGTAR